MFKEKEGALTGSTVIAAVERAGLELSLLDSPWLRSPGHDGDDSMKKKMFVLISVLWATFSNHYMCVSLQQR